MPDDLPRVITDVPGPRSRDLAKRLEQVECPEVTYMREPPVFWERASGANVWDVDGNRYVDLLAGFGVAPLGYAHPEVLKRGAQQAEQLQNALSDVYPARVKVELLEALERALPGDLGCAILSCSGSDAVESAFGALDVTYREHFRGPFDARLPHRTRFVPWGDADAARDALRGGDCGAILVEPIQGRGGIRTPPAGFIGDLRRIADEAGVLLIADEVYTGLGRTGHWLACEAEGVLPDVVALGKALGGGFPISACAGRPEVMRRWGASSGEALHTSTHQGNPVGCAMALAVLELLERERLVERVRTAGAAALERLERDLAGCPSVVEVRGRGFMIGIELDSPASAQRVIEAALRSGWILIGESEDLRVLSLTPALSISDSLLERGLDRIVELCGS
jgi:4-aminobutyrate aminotransferase/(S)-3-amino-2-methylpropionate transaminase